MDDIKADVLATIFSNALPAYPTTNPVHLTISIEGTVVINVFNAPPEPFPAPQTVSTLPPSIAS